MKGLFSTIDETTPKWKLSESLIGTNPGLGFRPMPDVEQGSLIWYESSNQTQISSWVSLLDEFLKGLLAAFY
jgi:sodium/potassium-transporting ATPase subunit beta